MATTVEELRAWLTWKEPKYDYVLIVCDTYDWEDYPVYCKAEELADQIYKFDGRSMQKIMEIYDLHADLEDQLSKSRTGLHLIDEARKAREETKD